MQLVLTVKKVFKQVHGGPTVNNNNAFGSCALEIIAFDSRPIRLSTAV